MQAELVSDLSCGESVGQILLVGKDEKKGVAQFVFVEHALELLAGFGDTVSVVGVDDKDDTLSVLEVWKSDSCDKRADS